MENKNNLIGIYKSIKEALKTAVKNILADNILIKHLQVAKLRAKNKRKIM
jgi:hypothetical protein